MFQLRNILQQVDYYLSKSGKRDGKLSCFDLQSCCHFLFNVIISVVTGHDSACFIFD